MTLYDFLTYALPFLGALVGGLVGGLINLWLETKLR